MYKCMKLLIEKKFYKTFEEVRTKLDTFYAKKRLTNEEYAELNALLVSIYDLDKADSEILY